MSRVFINGSGDQGSIWGRVIPKTQKMVLDTVLLNTQHYKVRIKGKVEQSRELSSTPLHLGVVDIEKEAFGSPSTKVTNFTYLHVCQKSNKYKILSIIRLFRGHKWIPDKILDHNHVPIEWIIIFSDKFAIFNPNVHEMDKLASPLCTQKRESL